MNFNQTLDYLYNSLPMFQKIGGAAFNKGLDKTHQLLAELSNPHYSFQSIHIAGTNGKGSVSSMLAAIFQSAGYKTGLYTSPHLKNFTERIRVNGLEIPELHVVGFVEKVKPLIEKIKPSFFELTVAMAFDFFRSENIDIAIVEVGMGGRLDSTNVIIPELSLITNISYDHQQFLGNTLPEIAGEKAGIIKPGVPVVISEWQDEVQEVFKNTAVQNHSEIVFASELLKADNPRHQEGYLLLDLKKNGQVLYKDLYSQLAGNYQLKNIPAVVTAIEILRSKYNIPETAIRTGIKNVCTLTGLKGRWQVLSHKPLVICDTAHNEAGIKGVVSQIFSLQFRKLHIVLGVVKDKDVNKVLDLLPASAEYYFCQPELPRALESSELGRLASLKNLKGEVFTDVNKAFAASLEKASEEDLIFIGGSTFTVAGLHQL